MNSGVKSTFVSVILHGAAFGAVLLISANAQSDTVASASDPLLAMLADPDADPTKAAGLVGEEPGLAQGSLDGKTLEEEDYGLEEMKALNEAAEEALATPLPEPEPVPAEPERAEPVPATPAPATPKEATPAETKPKPSPKPKPKPDTKSNSGGKKMSFEEFQRRNRTGNKPKPGTGSGRKPGSVKVSKIDVGKIGIGSGGGRFGVPDGTGGNGGEGGRAVASAQQLYAAEVARKLASHLDNVLAQSPLTLDASVSVTVRLNVDSQGNISFLEISGSSDSQVRDRVQKAVSRIGKFRRPPEGRAFSVSIPDVVLRPLN